MMNVLYNVILVIVSLGVSTSCDTKLSQSSTAERDEEVHGHVQNSQYAQEDADFVVEAYVYHLALQEYGKVAMSKESVPDVVKQFAEQSIDYYKELNEDLKRTAEANNIQLPKGVGEDVQEVKQELMEQEGVAFADEYFDVVGEVQHDMISRYMKALYTIDDPQLQDWVRLASAKIAEREEIVDQMEEYTEQMN